MRVFIELEKSNFKIFSRVLLFRRSAERFHRALDLCRKPKTPVLLKDVFIWAYLKLSLNMRLNKVDQEL